MSTEYHSANDKLISIFNEYFDNNDEFVSITKFNDGQSNPTFLLETTGKRYVLRSKPPGNLLKSAHQVDREFRLIKALENSAVSVPRCLFLFDDKDRWPLMFYVMEFLDGRIFRDPALMEINDATCPGKTARQIRSEIYDGMNKTLADLHDVDYQSIGLSDFGKAGNYYERQFSRWSKQYIASETENYSNIGKLVDWLEKNLPPDNGNSSLVHGDYRLDNLVFNKNEKTVLGVLDWELYTIGHPYSDLAYQCMQWRLPYEGEFRGLGGLDREALGLPDEEEYVARYCERRGLDGIENWNFYLAFSFFRLAAILQGVYKRSLDGNASNPEKARLYGEAVPILGELAMDVID